MASKGLGPRPRRRASALAHGCGRGGRVLLPLARAAAVSTGLRVPLLAGHPVVLQRRVLHLRLDGGGQGEAELSPPEESTWQGPNARVASLAGAGYSRGLRVACFAWPRPASLGFERSVAYDGTSGARRWLRLLSAHTRPPRWPLPSRLVLPPCSDGFLLRPPALTHTARQHGA